MAAPGKLQFGCSLLTSVLAHVLGIALLTLLSLSTPEKPPVYRVQSMEPIRLMLPETLWSPPPPAAAKRTPAQRSEAKAMEKAKLVAPPAAPAPPPAPAPIRSARQFQLPEPVRPAPVEQVLLQPDSPNITAPLNTRLPRVMFWAAEEIRPVRPPARKFIAPGRKAEPVQMPQLDSEPKLEVPNRQPRVSDIKLASGAELDRPPALARPPSTTMPIRTFVPPVTEAVRPAVIEPFEGDSARIIALNDRPAPMSQTLTVPAGNLIPPTAPAGAGESSTAGTGNGAGSNATGDNPSRAAGAGSGTAAQGASASQGSAAKSSTGAGASRAAGGVAGGSGGRTSETAKGAGGGSGSGDTGRPGGALARGTPPGPLPAASALPSAPVKILHPETGVFNVVVLQGFDSFPEAAGILHGRPIYSVYLKVGAPKEWIMQFCSPDSSVAQKGAVVTLGNPAVLKAPFPRVTVLPPAGAVSLQRRLIVHGFLQDSGGFRGLDPVGAEGKEAFVTLLPFLKQWEFRPATRDGRPVEVEVLLVAPPEGFQ